MKRFIGAALAAVITVGASAATAQEAHTWTTEDTFDNVTFAVQNAIIGAGLVVDHVSHTGDMLERTKDAVGGTKTLFTGADVFSFCSAQTSREVMEADITNFQFCPYTIFVYQTPEDTDHVTVGFRSYEQESMQPVTDLLTGIVKDALMLD
ncbi:MULTISPECIES: DUF302 domain-containing protein [Thioclava]|uniref:DUF302 domain-containing protein n=1 Tax=Thioclava nitratireducens TaxID=1915078 RepID=A0ABN4X1J7_9RHOB|nr:MULTISPECIES: DUF302 domain-containing protein [Thioclava]AQS46390.1 DUF302 domain-containing protein [Thioclava nitratireducens]OWY02446.1 DUF302 domain-containing protein [Thioclava sp. IC9]OWY02479.1 DUF302 domain-containing protein [Thioclava sp. F1Mire-8]OWY08141.1 DUF302 domain-containing protein [Thioclava sp. F42-5]PWE49919.1 DUF302 domain-containing protein [Thioclava sp. NG1]